MIKIEPIGNVTTKALEEINALIPQLSSSAKPLTYARLLEMTRDARVPILIAKDAGRIIGIGMIVVYNVFTEKRAWMEEIVVDEQYRGQGIGEKISKKLLEIAKQEKVERVYLSSAPKRVAANKLYQKLGFERKETNVYKIKL